MVKKVHSIETPPLLRWLREEGMTEMEYRNIDLEMIDFPTSKVKFKIWIKSNSYLSHTIVAMEGIGFIAIDVTFKNKAEPLKHRVVALCSYSDLLVFFRCAFRRY